jgi:hypothetical protein
LDFASPYWNEKTKIEMLCRWLLVHSYLYYELDISVVSDHLYDKNQQQLKELIEDHREDFKNSRYYYAMSEFDGSSGFGFVSKLNVHDWDCVARDAHMISKRR